MTNYPRRRRALLVTDDDVARALITDALAKYAFDVESEPGHADVVIIVGSAGGAARLELLSRMHAPVVAALRDRLVDDGLAGLLRREHIVLPFPVAPIEIVRAARRLTREIVTIW